MIAADELLAMVTARVAAAEKIAELQELVDTITARLRDELPDGNHNAGPWVVQVQTAHRLNTARMSIAYPADEYPALYKPTVDIAAVRHHIVAAELEPFTDTSRRVVVK